MDPKTQELVELVKRKFGLEEYFLKRYAFYRSVDIYQETQYALSMEWFPFGVIEEDEDLNPDGTAVIEIDVQSRRIMRAIFVGDKTFALNGIVFKDLKTDDMISWIEKETGLVFGKQFYLFREEEGELEFRSGVNGMPTLPPGLIEIQYDSAGRLTLISVNGTFPPEEIEEHGNIVFSQNEMERMAKKQLKPIMVPSFEQECYFTIYGIEEVYIGENGLLPPPSEQPVTAVNELLEWKTPLRLPFERTEWDLVDEVTAGQAYSYEPSPDALPILLQEEKKCILAATDFLRQQYPQDSEKWLLKTLYRAKGYIHAELGLKQQETQPARKLVLIINAKDFQVINYVDNQPLLDELFSRFKAPEQPAITKEKAFEKLSPYLTVEPVYVFDSLRKQYVPSKKLDCAYGVDAVNGKVILLNNME
ncbi:hypothetical protein [Heyndrickxia acidiproducens]|uniref:hypothetical protein n=1 Tax=Heyndrickxia acidiproducens TaxID=1121084 RepID=UPI000375425B|nr:hypothetical protein [Heyndrickxia acidiproducens]